MTNRIGGDYSAEALEAFRAAYADRVLTPEDLDIEERSGLPTSNVSNTSPWIAHTGLWSYPSGRGPEEDLRRAPVGYDYNPGEEEYEAEDSEDSDGESDLSEEEIDQLLEEILNELSDDK